MEITHVIGEDHINNTPRQINISESVKRAGADVRACVDDGDDAVKAAQTSRCGERDAVSR